MNNVDRGKKHAPTVQRFSDSIITDCSHMSEVIFLIAGFEHREIMQSLNVNYIIFEHLYIIDSLDIATLDGLKEVLRDFKPFFISTNEEDFIGSLRLHKKHFQKIVKRLYLIDLEILKATELITADELAQNDYPIGLELPLKYSFKDYVDEVQREGRHYPKTLFEYLKAVLEMETMRNLLNAS